MGNGNNQAKHTGFPALGSLGACKQSRTREALPIPGVFLPCPIPTGHLWALGTLVPSVLPAHHALPHKRSDNSLSLSLFCCSYGSEVFRSCRKQSYGRKLAPALALHSPFFPAQPGLSSPCLSCTLMCSGWLGVEDRLVLQLAECPDDSEVTPLCSWGTGTQHLEPWNPGPCYLGTAWELKLPLTGEEGQGLRVTH